MIMIITQEGEGKAPLSLPYGIDYHSNQVTQFTR
jgi:hypothetical protein